MKNLKQLKDDVKKSIKSTTKKDLALGITTGLAAGFGLTLLERRIMAGIVYNNLLNGEVIEKAVEKGAKVLVIKIVNAGEEVCACELH